MIKRAQIRQFLAIVDTGGFTRAAERVGITQPSLSAGIAELERIVGAQLFLRERRRVSLTQAGARLLTHARAIEREFRQAEARIAGARLSTTPLRIGVVASFPTQRLAAIAAHYTGQGELTVIEGSEADIRRRHAGGQIDAAITLARAGDGSAILPLIDEAYRLMVPQAHPLAGAPSVDAADLATETMIARRSCELLAETSRFFTERGVRPPFFLRSANDDRCMDMVRAGLGITTAPESLARPGVVAVALDGYAYRRTIALIPAAGAPDGDMRALASACRAAFTPVEPASAPADGGSDRA